MIARSEERRCVCSSQVGPAKQKKSGDNTIADQYHPTGVDTSAAWIRSAVLLPYRQPQPHNLVVSDHTNQVWPGGATNDSVCEFPPKNLVVLTRTGCRQRHHLAPDADGVWVTRPVWARLAVASTQLQKLARATAKAVAS
jgi:hypothetical protein